MSMIRICKTCGENFRKFSLKSKETHCQDCNANRKNKYRTNATRASREAELIGKRFSKIEKSLEVLHDTTSIEIETLVLTGIEPIINKIVKDTIDAELGDLKDIIVSSMTKAQKAQEQVKELTKAVRGYKISNTRMKNKIKAFEERLSV